MSLYSGSSFTPYLSPMGHRNVLVLRACLEIFKFNEGCGKDITFVDVPASFC